MNAFKAWLMREIIIARENQIKHYDRQCSDGDKIGMIWAERQRTLYEVQQKFADTTE